MNNKEKNAMMLIHDTSKAFKEMMRKKTEAVGIPDRYRMILLMLNHHDGSTQLDICSWTKLTAPSISLTLQKMEEEELIKRVVSEKDKRNMNIYITSKGKEMVDRIIVLIHETEMQLFSGIAQEDIQKVEEVLRKMLDNSNLSGGGING